MVDSGATTTFLSRWFIKENRVVTRKLDTPIPLYNIDGTLNRDGTITDVAILQLEIGAHREKVVFTVTDIGMEDIIIGLDWLRKHNPEVDWDQGTLKLSRCPASCRPCFEGQLPAQTDTRDTGVRPTARQRTRRVRKVKEVGKIRATVMVEEDLEPATPSSIPVEWDNSEDALLYSWEQGHALSNAPQLFAMAGYTYSQQLAEQSTRRRKCVRWNRLCLNDITSIYACFPKTHRNGSLSMGRTTTRLNWYQRPRCSIHECTPSLPTSR